MGPIILCAGVVFVLIGVVMVISQGGLNANDADSTPASDEPLAPIASRSANPTGRSAPSGASPRTPPPLTARQGNGMREQFFNARLGVTITFKHPQRGEVTGRILGTITYTELWQRVNTPSEPWVPTGNTFAAHWLGSQLLYEWQSRLYVLDEYQPR